MQGCPIRESSGQSVSDSPKPIVAYYALHRLQLPRHPPCALSNLITVTILENNFRKAKCFLYLLRKIFLDVTRWDSLERKCVFLTLYAVFKVLNSRFRPKF